MRRQVEAGIDVVSDGEMSKISYATYIADRFTGFAGDTPREPGQDLVEFPRLLKKLARARLDGEVPPAALRGRDPRQDPRAAAGGPANFRAACRRGEAGRRVPERGLARRHRAVPAQRLLPDAGRISRGRRRGAARRVRGHRRGRLPAADRCAGPRHGPAHRCIATCERRTSSCSAPHARRGAQPRAAQRARRPRAHARVLGQLRRSRIITTCRCEICCRWSSRPSRRRCCSRPPIRATRTNGPCSAMRSCPTTRS